MPDALPPSAGLPVVVQIGFAGPRDLDEPIREDVREHLVAALDKISGRIGPQGFLCGISQIAIGADTLFTEVCQSRQVQVPQRIFLPQPRDEYLDARDSKVPDFTSEQQEAAERLLNSFHVIEERVVSRAPSRDERFEETNLEIARESDVVICVTRSDAAGKAGGTRELLEMARRFGKPLLEIVVDVREDGVHVVDDWHPEFEKPPGLPPEVASLPVPARRTPPADEIPMTAIEYVEPLEKFFDAQAKELQRSFTFGACIIIGAHILATACAALVTKVHATWLLGVELFLLVLGFGTHIWLHGREAGRGWAMARLAAQIAQPVKALQHVRLSLDHLFQLPYPPAMRPLLRTINVLHLASTRRESATWQDARSTYVRERLVESQIPYYKHGLDTAESKRLLAHGLFYGFSLSAFLATTAKLIVHDHAWLVSILGIEAILLPVLAVSALSLAASFDLEARAHTYGDTHASLLQLKQRLENAKTKREFERLIIDTEMQLLGETVMWASRRSFTSVS